MLRTGLNPLIKLHLSKGYLASTQTTDVPSSHTTSMSSHTLSAHVFITRTQTIMTSMHTCNLQDTVRALVEAGARLLEHDDGYFPIHRAAWEVR